MIQQLEQQPEENQESADEPVEEQESEPKQPGDNYIPGSPIRKSHTGLAVFLTIIITAIIAGGGVYLWLTYFQPEETTNANQTLSNQNVNAVTTANRNQNVNTTTNLNRANTNANKNANISNVNGKVVVNGNTNAGNINATTNTNANVVVNTSTTSNTNSQAITNTNASTMADWQTYSDAKMKYTFDYPKSWTIKENDNEQNGYNVVDVDFYNQQSQKVADLVCPLPETGFEMFDFVDQTRNLVKNGITYEIHLGLGTPLPESGSQYGFNMIWIRPFDAQGQTQVGKGTDSCGFFSGSDIEPDDEIFIAIYDSIE